MASDDERRHTQDELLGSLKATADANARQLTAIALRLDTLFVTKEEFFPVKSLVYGMTSLMLMAVFGAMVALVIHRG